MPLEGAKELCELLYKGSSGNKANPIFYLSNSPWNPYNYLSIFLETQGFSKGPLLMRDIGISNPRIKSFVYANKYQK